MDDILDCTKMLYGTQLKASPGPVQKIVIADGPTNESFMAPSASSFPCNGSE